MKVLMVCLGNICRSPMAQAILERHGRERGMALTVDSAGTGDRHVGDLADPRTRAELARRGTPLDHRARTVRMADFTAFDHILAMDRSNLANLRALAPAAATAQVALMGDHDPDTPGAEVPDPYHDGPEAFTAVYDQLDRASRGFLDRIARR
jgi:protein-tyrosine phosphatase